MLLLPINIVAVKKQQSSITRLVLPSHGQVFLLGFEYLLQAFSDSKSFILCEHFHIRFIAASNKENTMLAWIFDECREGQIPRSLLRGLWLDLGFPLLIGGLSLRYRACHLGFPYDLSYIFLPLLVSFRSAYHVRRFQPRCSHTILFIHYKLASQHWETASPNYDLFYRIPQGD